jgi:hypothetical protein
MTTLRDITDQIEQTEAALAAMPHDSPQLTPSVRRWVVASMEARLARLRARQGALLVGAIVAIGVEEASRPDRPLVPMPPLGAIVRMPAREDEG